MSRVRPQANSSFDEEVHVVLNCAPAHFLGAQVGALFSNFWMCK